jgi:hypothetical protein
MGPVRDEKNSSASSEEQLKSRKLKRFATNVKKDSVL